MQKKLVLLGSFALLVGYCHGLCAPCPRTDVSLSSFYDCECKLGTFYDEKSRNCVSFSECPPSDIPNPLKELQVIWPNLQETLTNTLANLQTPNLELPEDVYLAMEVLTKKIETLKKELPEMLTPAIGPIVLKDRTILEKCKTDPLCVMMEALRRREMVKEMMPKLRPMLGDVAKKLMGYFDDLYSAVEKKGCSYLGNCPGSKAVTDMWKALPPMEDVADAKEVLDKIMEYFGDKRTYWDLMTQK